MYLKLRSTGFGNPLDEYHLPQRGGIGFLAKATHSGMLPTNIVAHDGCYTLLGAGAVIIRTRVKESA